LQSQQEITKIASLGMNKEQIITVLIGLVVGALLVAGYFAAKNFLPALKPKPPTIIVTQPSPRQSEATAGQTLPLTLINLIDKSSTKSADLVISGQTATGAAIFVFGNTDEKIASADAQGNFSGNLKLEDGENEITVTAFLDGKNSLTIRKNVTLEINP
jgi:hypothetical protein